MQAGMQAAMPQARTFAPSREDILSTLAFFFGDPASPEKLKDYSEAHAATCAPAPPPPAPFSTRPRARTVS